MACFPAGTVSGAPKFAPWRLSRNLSAPAAEFTPAAFSTSISRQPRFLHRFGTMVMKNGVATSKPAAA